MSAARVMRLPLSVDLSGFVELLKRLQVPHRVSEEGNEQVLWTLDHLVEDVRQLYQRFPDGNPDIELAPLPSALKAVRPSLGAQARASKVTAAILLLCLVVAGLTGLGENLSTLSWLTFLDFRVQGDYLYFTPLFSSLEQGQWWRLFSPMLVHFGLLHLAMNGLWYWELGRRIELRQGAWALLSLTLLFSLVSNVAQFVFGGPSLFGGLSGVLYGLLGHVWLYQWLAPHPLYRMPRGVLVMMLVWLLLCLSGLVSLLGFGAIANAAHVGGLLVGCLSGLLGGALARRKLSA
ncbi:rhomboid family intramembrane serine protease [Pseudomonas sp. MAFF212428]|uniref:Rhomboid family intramembrane serine protease n=1 Tax=Pseudomonas brassicae TaxID=2708063 RepID=A0A6B3NYE7_9PSED|nr:rhomboid family intramembrane serine protease [Pseudomonas brassicae]NER60347.1 rhomboid family intramembrane serine protease [Pseudomonas brassicae]NER66171.1 rhomboid family intramembrane serine protease [Pseudomonas brassicae]